MKKISIEIPGMDDYGMTEGLNQLKTNLSFCGKDIKVVAITSSVTNEGKSSIALRLSRTLAESGKKTLLIDGDMRKSNLVAKYHIQGLDKGLTHYLTGQAEAEDIIYKDEKEDLYLVPTGPLSPDPTVLLDSEIFEALIENARNDYDYVIIDAPPVGAVIDAVIIGKYCDGEIIVIEQGVIKRKIVQNVIKQLKMGDIRILGAVLNKIDKSNSAYGSYDYQYSYGYYSKTKDETHTKEE